MITLRILQRALGGEIKGGRQLLCPGPQHSLKDRSLSVWLSPDGDGFTCHSHSGDSWEICKDYIREKLGLPAWQPGDGQNRSIDRSRLEAFDRAAVDAQERRIAEDRIRIERARSLWGSAKDPRGTLAEAYLRSRALILDDDISGRVLRYHPACPWRDENTGTTINVPALVAAFRNIDNNTLTAVHRIRLEPERWPKAERRMLGVVARSAVMLGPVGSMLAIGEGIETCLAARQLGITPTWALGSVGMIAKFPVIDAVERLRILGETGKASADAVKFVGRRWHGVGRRVQIVTPSAGDDLNDELMASRTA